MPAEYEHTAFNAEGELTDEAGKIQTALMRSVWRAKVPVNLSFYKSCNKELTGGEFTFQLLDGDGKVVAEATNDAEDRIDFAFELDHTNLRTKLHYTVREVAGDDPAYTYDSGEKHVELYVSWNEENPYELKVDITYLDEDLTFTNIWTEPEPEPEPTPDPEPAPKPAPKPAAATPATGDPTPAFGLVAAMGGLLAAAGAVLRRRR